MAKSSELHIGQTLYDNDPRRPGRTVTISNISCGYAYYRIPGRRTPAKIWLCRIFTNGLMRRGGYSTVAPPETVAA